MVGKAVHSPGMWLERNFWGLGIGIWSLLLLFQAWTDRDEDWTWTFSFSVGVAGIWPSASAASTPGQPPHQPESQIICSLANLRQTTRRCQQTSGDSHGRLRLLPHPEAVPPCDVGPSLCRRECRLDVWTSGRATRL